MHKRNRTIQDKIYDAIDKVGNLYPQTRDIMIAELASLPDIANNVARAKKYIIDRLSLPEMGKTTLPYWIARGWPEPDARYQQKNAVGELSPRLSPYSKEFWLKRINPATGQYYTPEEADWERNTKRPVRKEYWMNKGYTEEDAITMAAATKANNNKNGSAKSSALSTELLRSFSPRCKEYWMLRGYNENEATKIIAKRQSTFSLDKCIDQYGEEEGRLRWNARQEKWHKSYKKQNYSKISQELFWEIAKNLSTLDDIYFAQLDHTKQLDDSGANHELRLTLDRVVMPDFIDVKQKKIIEFDGVYWHGNVGRGNKQRDTERDVMYNKYGYAIKRVNERDFKTNKVEVIAECLIFLNS